MPFAMAGIDFCPIRVADPELFRQLFLLATFVSSSMLRLWTSTCSYGESAQVDPCRFHMRYSSLRFEKSNQRKNYPLNGGNWERLYGILPAMSAFCLLIRDCFDPIVRTQPFISSGVWIYLYAEADTVSSIALSGPRRTFVTLPVGQVTY